MPLCIDLFCGLGGWAEGFLEEGYDVIGFDIERHDYGTGGYPGQLVLQDALTLHGSQFRNADIIVASPPCQNYSYMAMPWSRAKREVSWQKWQRDSPFWTDRSLDDLFNACLRIQREASQSAGRHIPMVVENVKGAQPWVGRAAWHYGSYYLWGDVPALMPWNSKVKGASGSWFFAADQRGDPREASLYSLRSDSIKMHGSGEAWFDEGFTKYSSRDVRRKAASAQIAKIPFPLANHIARIYRPEAIRTA